MDILNGEVTNENSLILIGTCLLAYLVWGFICMNLFHKHSTVVKYIAYPFSMTHIMICLVGGMLRFLSWDRSLTWCQTYEDKFNNWDVLIITQSLGYFAIDMFVVSRDPNYYIHHSMCIIGYVVVLFIYPLPLKIALVGMYFAEIGGFLLSLRKLNYEFVFRIFLILYAASRVGMTIAYTSYCYCAGLFSGHIPDLPHLIFCICGLAVTAQNWVWCNAQKK